MRKLLCLIVILLSTIIFLTGCWKPPVKTELHAWHTDINRKKTKIIYEIKSVPTEIVDGNLYWDINDVQIEFNFGWNGDYGIDHIYGDKIGIIVCFAAYFFWPENNYDNFQLFYDDYRNPTDAIFLQEISVEEFLSDKYKACYGEKAGLLNTNPPIFDESHESLIVTLSQEVFDISEEKQLDNSNSFRFGVTPVYQFAPDRYSVDFGCKYDGFRLKFSQYPETDKIYLSSRP